jgi:hypothetical protein
MRIVQGQHIGQCDQRTHTVHLFQPGHFGANFVGGSAPCTLLDSFVLCCTSGAARRRISSTRVRHSLAPCAFRPVPPARGSPSDGFALWHCDVAPAPADQDQFWPVVPASEHRADRRFDDSRRSIARSAHEPPNLF